MFKLWGIRKNILFLVLTPTLLVSIVLSVYFVLERVETIEKTHLDKGTNLASTMSLLTHNVTIDDTSTIERLFNQFRDKAPDILALAILDEQNKFIIRSGNDRFIKQLESSNDPNLLLLHADKNVSLHTSPIRFMDSDSKFNVAIIINRQQLILDQYHTLTLAIIIAIGMLSLSLYIAYYLSKTIGEPLQKITDELEAINKGQLDIKLFTPEIPELAKITNTISSLANSLQLARDNMQLNVDQATADLTQTLETIEIQNVELDMARKQAVQASRVKSEFLANISHEIRTPMNGIIGFTNLLLKSKVDVTQKDYLMIIRKSANHLLGIIEDILDFSKIEAGKMSLDKTTFSLHECVEEVMTLLSPSSIKKNLELIPLIYKDVPEQLMGDPLRVKQILTNLISNAIKFTEKGSIVVRVSLEDEESNSIVIRTTITDTGIGMTDEQISKLFQPFSQVNQSINRHHSGTGLGLVICKKLVEQMGGDISIESKSNEGTSFSFTLRSEKLSGPLQMESSVIKLSHQPVYLFDPHPMALLAMKQLLSSWDMEIHDYQTLDKLTIAVNSIVVKDNCKPLFILGTNEYSQAICDIVTTIKNLDYLAIFVVGNPGDSYKADQLMTEGVSQYLVKPLTRKQLLLSFENIELITKNDDVIKQNDQYSHHYSQLKILAVDDNLSNLKLISILLEEMSINVIQAYDGLSAVEICKEEKFDLIFMDIRMPGIDGIETSKRIHKDSQNLRTPIIALTAHAMAGEKEQFLSSGLQDFMIKPISSARLNHIISKWTGQVAITSSSKTGDIDSSQESSIDWVSCLNISGGRATLARDMLSDLIKSIPEFKTQLDKSITGNEQLFLTNVHQLNGLACYSGVPVLRSIVADFELQLKKNAPITQLETIQKLLLSEMDKVSRDSEQFLTATTH